jgi:hypothetical protein
MALAAEDAPVFERKNCLHCLSEEWIQSILAGFEAGFMGWRTGLWNWGWKWRWCAWVGFDWDITGYAGCLVGSVGRFKGFVGKQFFKYSASQPPLKRG